LEPGPVERKKKGTTFTGPNHRVQRKQKNVRGGGQIDTPGMGSVPVGEKTGAGGQKGRKAKRRENSIKRKQKTKPDTAKKEKSNKKKGHTDTTGGLFQRKGGGNALQKR